MGDEISFYIINRGISKSCQHLYWCVLRIDSYENRYIPLNCTWKWKAPTYHSSHHRFQKWGHKHCIKSKHVYSRIPVCIMLHGAINICRPSVLWHGLGVLNTACSWLNTILVVTSDPLTPRGPTPTSGQGTVKDPTGYTTIHTASHWIQQRVKQVQWITGVK